MQAFLKQIKNPYLLLALTLALIYHGGLLVSGSYKNTYDAYIHIFFANHYAQSWFDDWEYRWYTGFSVTSYPPASQQSIALLSFAVGLQNGFIIVQLCAILFTIVGVYRFSRLWVSEEAAGYAALLTVFASSINETVHVFGQLPTTFSIGFLLNALPYVYRWLRNGRWHMLLIAWLFNAATTAGHHVTTIFGAVFFVGPTILAVVVNRMQQPLEGEHVITWSNRRIAWWRKGRQWLGMYVHRLLPVLLRTGLYCIGLGVVLIVVILPYWQLSRTNPIVQVPIPHASRDSFIANPSAGLVFWLIPYGLSLLCIPYVLYKGFTTRAWPIAGSFCILFVLGTGGTTPIPHLILRGAFNIVTLDRFTFWATIIMLPLLGELVVSLLHGGIARLLRTRLGTSSWRVLQIGLLLSYLGTGIFISNYTHFHQFQPAAINMQPIVDFLNKDQHWRWRYLTLGFGDQLSWLSAQTNATSVDGDYHAARGLPELNTTPVGSLDSAKFSGVAGIGSLQQFLAAPEKYNLKFVFSNDQFYDPLLYFSGWHRLQRLENGIVVWERADIPPLPAILPRKETPVYERIMWGIIPLSAVFLALAALVSPLWQPVVSKVISILGIDSALRWLGKQLRSIGLIHAFLHIFHHNGRKLDYLMHYDLLNQAAIKQPASNEIVQADGTESTNRSTGDQSPVRSAKATPTGGLLVNRGLRSSTTIERMMRWSVCLVLVGLPMGSMYLRFLSPTKTPSQVVQQYYNALDFRQFQTAYDTLDPLQRPSYAQYTLQLSVQNGFVASYAKLDYVRVSIQTREPGRLVVQAHLFWITALGEYPTVDTLVLIQRQGQWYITPPTTDPTIPADEFFRRGTVSWHDQGRAIVTTGTTDFSNILDRPQLQILSARLVKVGMQYSVVGEVINTDTNPADLTVEAILFDSRGQILTNYNAQTGIIHKLLPKEVTPFRIDFVGVAATVLDPPFNAQVASVAVYAKAVVTDHDLYAPVDVEQVHVVMENGQAHLQGMLFNPQTYEVTIPHILVTYYDSHHHVVWVDSFFVPDAVEPERLEPFDEPITPFSTVHTLIDQGAAYANTFQHSIDFQQASASWQEIVPLPASLGYSSLRVIVQPFVASTS